jgi:hypothetical protein
MPSEEWITLIKPGLIEGGITHQPKPGLLYRAGQQDQGARAEFTVPMAFEILDLACRTHIERMTDARVKLRNIFPTAGVSGVAQFFIYTSRFSHLGEIRLRKMGEQSTEIGFYTAIAPPHPDRWGNLADSLDREVRIAKEYLVGKAGDHRPRYSPAEREAKAQQRLAQYKKQKNKYDKLCTRILKVQGLIFNELIRCLNRDINEIVASQAAAIFSSLPRSRPVQPKQKQHTPKPRSPNSETMIKLERLQEMRQQKKAKRPKWNAACQEIEIDHRTAELHAPELKKHWNDPD